MSEQMWWFSMETEKVEEKLKEATNEEISAVAEDQQQAKKIAWQIQKQQWKDSINAKILSILLSEVENDNIIVSFFKIHKNSQINIFDLFFVFLPFLKDSLDSSLQEKFGEKLSFDVDGVIDYTKYINSCVDSKNLDGLPKDEFIDLVAMIANHYNLSTEDISSDSNSNEYQERLRQVLSQEIFNN